MPFLMIVEAVAQAKHVCQRGRVSHCHTIQMDLMGNKLLRRDKKNLTQIQVIQVSHISDIQP